MGSLRGIELRIGRPAGLDLGHLGFPAGLVEGAALAEFAAREDGAADDHDEGDDEDDASEEAVGRTTPSTMVEAVTTREPKARSTPSAMLETGAQR